MNPVEVTLKSPIPYKSRIGDFYFSSCAFFVPKPIIFTKIAFFNMIPKDDAINFMFEIYDEIIKSNLLSNEKKEWDKCLNYFNIDLYEFLNILVDNIKLTDHTSNTDISFSVSESAKNEAIPFIEELRKNVKRKNPIIEKNFNTLLHRINIMYSFKIKEILEKDGIKYPDFEKENLYSSLKYNRFGFPRELEYSNSPSIRTFTTIDKHKARLNITSLRTRLINENFLDKDTIDNDSFEIIFNKKSINKNFEKINWLGSIYELKTFINYLFEKDVVVKDMNYYLTIIDCFLIKGTDIEYSQLKTPKGSTKRLELLKDIISKSIIRF